LKLSKLKHKLISTKGRRRPMRLNLDLSKKLNQLESELKQKPVLSKLERIKKLLIKNKRPKRKPRKRIQKQLTPHRLLHQLILQPQHLPIPKCQLKRMPPNREQVHLPKISMMPRLKSRQPLIKKIN